MIRTLFLLLALVSAAHGQIYADFTVSHGGAPLGTFRARLDYDKAPRTCANFIGLATGQRPWINVVNGRIQTTRPYYDGLTFHRLDHDFVIQGGSPNGLGNDGPGYVILDEYHPALRHSGRYLLSMAKTSQPHTGGSQFFITLAATPGLDDKHSIFGEVISGRDIIDNFTNPALFPTTNERPNTPITINSVAISGPDLASFNLNDPSLKLPVIEQARVIGTRAPTAANFTLTFDRQFQTDYLIYSSQSLSTWTYFRHVRSRDGAPGFTYPVPHNNSPRFFVSVAQVDYSAIYNPTANVLVGKQLRISDRNGNALTLIPNGSGGGTWTHSDGGSGTLSNFQSTDGTSDTGSIASQSSGAYFFPLASFTTQLSPAAGPGAWTTLGLNLCFHHPGGGWAEGQANYHALGPAVNWAFSILP
ncbi:peptidylprolyl isomerase [Luteolibacter sp. GHJ8]|uniref:peptidylprolyl isomerase n=1 Tax=Luteolibacter rhizosphaerae TaxID=2989719 RepID=A0ABT3G2A5_9BACT|nr:peptidylprolyl isomerase [Luteolibacter rhizosphaerae]MCW1913634.1 peptidylprolyl isomerase [Luteolibacter rhizosphaerae]